MMVTEVPAQKSDHFARGVIRVKEQNPVLTMAVQKLALAGEQAGFTVQQMIEVLDTGMSVETFLDLVCSQIELSQSRPEISC